MNSKLMTWVWAVMIILGVVPARAAYIYVDPGNKSATTNGTSPETAWTTIAQGLADLSDSNAIVKGGHTLWLAASNYTVALSLLATHSGHSATNMNAVRALGGTAGVALSATVIDFSSCSYVLVEGIHSSGTKAGVYTALGSRSNIVRNCSFRNGGRRRSASATKGTASKIARSISAATLRRGTKWAFR